MALVRLPGGGWIEAAAVSSVLASPHHHDVWVVQVGFRDGVTQGLQEDEPMTHEEATALADEIASLVQKSNDEVYLKRYVVTKEDTEKAMTLLGWATSVAESNPKEGE